MGDGSVRLTIWNLNSGPWAFPFHASLHYIVYCIPLKFRGFPTWLSRTFSCNHCKNKTQRKVPTLTNSRKERKVQLYYISSFSLSTPFDSSPINRTSFMMTFAPNCGCFFFANELYTKIKSKRWRSIIGLSRDDYDNFDHMSFGFLNDELFEPRKRFMKRSHPILTRNQEKWLQLFSWHCLDLVKVSKWFSHPEFRSHTIT